MENSRQNTRFKWRNAKALEAAVEKGNIKADGSIGFNINNLTVAVPDSLLEPVEAGRPITTEELYFLEEVLPHYLFLYDSREGYNVIISEYENNETTLYIIASSHKEDGVGYSITFEYDKTNKLIIISKYVS